MKTFDQFLTEGRDAPLYHGLRSASWETIYKIIVDDKALIAHTRHSAQKLLKPYIVTTPEKSVSGPNWLKGLSATRNLNFAWQWSFDGIGEHQAIVFEFDQAKLARDFQIIPIQYWDGRARKVERVASKIVRNEYEEFIISNKPISMSYVKRILVRPNFIDILKEYQVTRKSAWALELIKKLESDPRFTVVERKVAKARW